MPHFHFDLISQTGATIVSDNEGADFPDLEAAIADAERRYADMLAEPMFKGA
jgi:hypothetical protein